MFPFNYNLDNDPEWDYLDDKDYADGFRFKKYSNKNKKCECGLDAAIKAGATGGRHAEYCPKYERRRD